MTMKKDEKGRFVSAEKEESHSYGYYSNLLKKPFDSLDELKKAEDDYNQAHKAELEKAEARKTEAKKVEEALKAQAEASAQARVDKRKAYKEYLSKCDEARAAYLEACDKANETANIAYKDYQEKLKGFCDKYGSFHTTMNFVSGPTSCSITTDQDTDNPFKWADEMFDKIAKQFFEW